MQNSQQPGQDTGHRSIRAQVEARTTEIMPPDPADRKNGKVLSSEFVMECLKMNELGDGMLYSAIHQGKFLYVPNSDQWYQFQDHCWRLDQTNRALASVENVVKCLVEEYASQGTIVQEAIAEGEESEGKAKIARTNQSMLMKRISRLRKDAGRIACLKFSHSSLRRHLARHGSELDMHPMLLACPNGVVDLTTGKLRAGRPEDLITKRTNTEWQGIDANRQAWVDALRGIYSNDEELIAYLQRLFGYGITGQISEHIFPVFWGRGRNGKSLIIESLADVLGDHAGPVPAEMLLASTRSASASSATPEIIALKGLRVAVASETDDGRRFSPARVKWLTGGDTLTGRGLHDKHFTKFKPSHMLVLLTNHKPSAPDNDFAFWERAFLIPHKISFVDREPQAPYERPADKELPAKLQACKPGILAWLVEGCLLWQKYGLKPPEVVLEATREYKQDEDLLHDFLEACCVIAPEAEAWSSDLYRVFERWYEKVIGGKKTPSHKRFSKLLQDREQFGVKKTSGKMKYFGIGIQHDSEFIMDFEQGGREEGT